jgi:hypothetical protein
MPLSPLILLEPARVPMRDGREHFFGSLPTRYDYAVEVRTPALLGPRYYNMLKANRVAHVYNHLYGMPSLAEQHDALGRSFSAPFTVMRLLTPRNMAYHDAVKAYQPYQRLVRPLPNMRKDTIRLIDQAVGDRVRAHVLVNNRSEGSAPLTVQALVDQLKEDASPVAYRFLLP